MSKETTQDGGWLSQFEKNRFFRGKLLTPRDMECGQAYHAERLHTFARSVVGTGIVTGLDIESVTETDNGLEVTVEPGLALDGHGRPVVVEQRTTRTVPAPTSDRLSLYLRYSEVPKETVPVPDTEGAHSNDTVANRAVEVFDLTYRESQPAQHENLPDIDVEAVEDAETIEDAAQTLAMQYKSTNYPESTEDPAIFLGYFERGPDGTWSDAGQTNHRSFVPDHQFLFTALLQHIIDTDNPHDTEVDERDHDVPADIDGIADRIGFLEAELQDLKADRDSLQRYTIRKTITDRARRFEQLANRIEAHSGSAGLLAREIAETAADRESLLDDERAYRENLEDLLGLLVDLGETLDGVTTEASLQQYLQAVADLQRALDGDHSLLAVTEAHDHVCEAADSLTVLVNVVPDE